MVIQAPVSCSFFYRAICLLQRETCVCICFASWLHPGCLNLVPSLGFQVTGLLAQFGPGAQPPRGNLSIF